MEGVGEDAFTHGSLDELLGCGGTQVWALTLSSFDDGSFGVFGEFEVSACALRATPAVSIRERRQLLPGSARKEYVVSAACIGGRRSGR